MPFSKSLVIILKQGVQSLELTNKLKDVGKTNFIGLYDREIRIWAKIKMKNLKVMMLF